MDGSSQWPTPTPTLLAVQLPHSRGPGSSMRRSCPHWPHGRRPRIGTRIAICNCIHAAALVAGLRWIRSMRRENGLCLVCGPGPKPSPAGLPYLPVQASPCLSVRAGGGHRALEELAPGICRVPERVPDPPKRPVRSPRCAPPQCRERPAQGEEGWIDRPHRSPILRNPRIRPMRLTVRLGADRLLILPRILSPYPVPHVPARSRRAGQEFMLPHRPRMRTEHDIAIGGISHLAHSVNSAVSVLKDTIDPIT